MRLLVLLLASSLMPASLCAQTLDPKEEASPDNASSRWSLGLAAAVRNTEYAGADDRSVVIPYVAYEGEKFYFRGITAGYHLVEHGGFGLDVMLSGRMDGMDRKDFGVRELARRGIDRRLLSDRDDSVDAGAALTWSGTAGEFELRLLADVGSVSEGYEATLDYAYPLHVGKTLIKPGLGVSFLSSDLANYYYGTLDKEVARGLPLYRPGSAVVPHVGVQVAHAFSDKWRIIGGVEYRKLPDELKDSPLVEEGADSSTGLFLGVARSF